jgi:hypothetical protein
MAVGLRHNHDISFIATKCKSLALVYYVTNYATKSDDPAWKRAVAAREVLELNKAQEDGQSATQGTRALGDVSEARGSVNRPRQFILRVANRVFTERALSQVEVIANLKGFESEFSSNSAWIFVNVCSLYWRVFQRWRHLRDAAGRGDVDGGLEDRVVLRDEGQKITFLDVYPHRGEHLRELTLYEYLSVVVLKRKTPYAAVRTEVEFDSSWRGSPGVHAVVCLDGYLGMNFDEEDELYYRR